ncbi:hypothetical protein QNO00_13590 [Arthrobacter sp. zg-Y1219]|uniref:hypothetical protein n=1 Tax=Arthrobacter sp. zg-Y1219 TaxID=3049067 RepID=UPI0024C46280|nr:hypothetical protein [Arthrobacter sp. zg-Y1219]MDK1361292.1 hypothetical protein [Arthrobacter sp. zg-Y1219]
MVTFIKSLPQPLKALYILTFAVFAVGFIVTLIGITTGKSAGSPPVWFPVMGALVVLIGICLATDLNQSAKATSEAAKGYRPMGVKASPSFSPTPGFMRLIGAFFIVFGCLFVFVSLTFLS